MRPGKSRAALIAALLGYGSVPTAGAPPIPAPDWSAPHYNRRVPSSPNTLSQKGRRRRARWTR